MNLFKLSRMVIIFFGIVSAEALAKTIPPLSKVVITSESAICKKDTQHDGYFIFEYHNNVCVTFADQSQVTADTLEIIFDGKNSHVQGKSTPTDVLTKVPKKKLLDSFKSIVFKKNVHVVSHQRQAKSDLATFYLNNQLCLLEGNVSIWQNKTTPRDIPVMIQSAKAELNLVTSQVQLLGSSEKPVQTIVVLEGHPALIPKKKKGKKKSHVKNTHSTPGRSS